MARAGTVMTEEFVNVCVCPLFLHLATLIILDLGLIISISFRRETFLQKRMVGDGGGHASAAGI